MNTANFSVPLRRFVWKEYRTLRGLWLAVLILGLFIDWLVGVLMSAGTDWGTLRLFIALASATLYATGAAAVLFSMEHEEQTYNFLRGLPVTWLPTFAGKLLMATVSAIALAAALSLIGILASSMHLPTSQNATLAIGILGVAILEAIAWGTLCSLLLKRPLVAAIATLIVSAIAVHLAVNLSSPNSAASTNPHSYVRAVPLRLMIVVAVFTLSIFIARNWLATGGGRGTSSGAFAWRATFRHRWKRESLTAPIRSRRNRSGILARLLWQSWRESWKLLPLPIVVAGLCIAVVWLLAEMRSEAYSDLSEWVALATMFFAPALCGALAFAADQRRGQVRFLAEHATAPRYVWLSRHIVWLGAPALVATFLTIVISVSVVTLWQYKLQRDFTFQSNWGVHYSSYNLVGDFLTALTVTSTGAALASFGSLAAYSIGQFCSMLLRSDLLAAFLALLLAVVFSAWVTVLFLWQLCAWTFLLPLAAGLMLATWLRAPDWITGRNTIRAWLKPLLAIVATLIVLSMALPQERLAQLRFAPRPQPALIGKASDSPEADAAAKDWIAQGEETAAMYLKAASLLYAPLGDDPLAPWPISEFGGGPGEPDVGGISEKLIPPEQLKAFLTARRKWLNLAIEQREKVVKLVIEASKQPTCQFSFHYSAERWDHGRPSRPQLTPDKTYKDLDDLLTQLTTGTVTGEVNFERLLAGLRMSAHLRNNQPTLFVIHQLQREQEILQQISDWNVESDRTNAERRDAITQLQKYFGTTIHVAGGLLADEQAIRKVILGKESPIVMGDVPVPIATNLAFLANELPWERERALIALDLITNQNTVDVEDLIASLSQIREHDAGRDRLRRWLQPNYQPALWMVQQPAAATSYLVSLEYNARVQVNELFHQLCNAKTRQRALLLEIALAMYRVDHDEYPATLTDLVPKYLEREPLDPYSMQPFSYAPHGLELKLHRYSYAYGWNGINIEAHTPLLWSVGPNDVRLQRTIDSRQINENISEGESGQATDPSLVLTPDGGSMIPEPYPLVFPLPKQ